MFIELLATNYPVYLAAVMTIVVSITLHELAHGVAAIKLGDDTPAWSGHMTWNPWVHMGPFSLIACFLAGIAWGSMPVDPTRLRGKRAEAIVAVVGPLVNLALAVLAYTALGLWTRYLIANAAEITQRIDRGMMVLEVVGSFNLLLFVFNLLPIPPLDGSKILASFHRGYGSWMANPANQGVGLMLFIFAFAIARPIARELSDLGMAYVGLVAG